MRPSPPLNMIKVLPHKTISLFCIIFLVKNKFKPKAYRIQIWTLKNVYCLEIIAEGENILTANKIADQVDEKT